MKKSIIEFLFFTLITSILCFSPAMAESSSLEGMYHSAKDVNDKIIIYKTNDKEYLIVNSTRKWEAITFKGVSINSKNDNVFVYYKGVISWNKEKKQDVGFIHIDLSNDGKSLKMTHRWNFWQDTNNPSAPREETWTKEQ